MPRLCSRALLGVALVHLCLLRSSVEGFQVATPARSLGHLPHVLVRPCGSNLRLNSNNNNSPSVGTFDAAIPAPAPPSNPKQAGGLLGPLRAKRVLGLVLGQSAIGLAGLGLAWGLHGSPWLAFGPGFDAAARSGALAALGLGAVAAIPMLAFIAFGEVLELDRRFPSLAAVSAATKKTVLISLGKDFRPVAAGFAALLLALAAGAGEEILFRGVMQEEITSRVSGPAGLIVASLIFGALHAITPVYALLAAVAGGYFGWLYNACNHSIVVPGVAHALYDWVALLLVHYEVTKGGPSPARDAAQFEILGLGGGSKDEEKPSAPPDEAAVDA